jgi:hypothetical protein
MTHIALDHVMKPYEQLLGIDLDGLQGYAHLPAFVSSPPKKIKKGTPWRYMHITVAGKRNRRIHDAHT